MVVKGQILVDLVAKFTEKLGDLKEGAKLEEAVRMGSMEVQQVW